MAASIRLKRFGKKKFPSYRIIVIDSREKRDGRDIETIGFYNPCKEPAEMRVNEERAQYWIKQGAIPSQTVKDIFRKTLK